MGKISKIIMATAALTLWQPASALVLTGEFSANIISSTGYGLANNAAVGETLTGKIWIDTDAAQLIDTCSDASRKCLSDSDENDKWIDITYSFMGNTYSPDNPDYSTNRDRVWAYDEYTSDDRDFFQVIEQDLQSSPYSNDYAYLRIYEWLDDVFTSANLEDLATLSINWEDSNPGNCSTNDVQDRCGTFYAREIDNGVTSAYLRGDLTSLRLNTANVTEPGSFALFSLGVVGLIIARRRLRRD